MPETTQAPNSDVPMETSNSQPDSPRWRIASIAILLLVLATTGAFWFGWMGGSQKDGIVVESKYLHLGTVWEDPDFEWKIPLENRSQKTVIIERFTTSCNCLQVEPKSLEIPAGQQREVTLKLNLTFVSTRNRDPSTADFTVKLFPHFADSSVPTAGWSVRGRMQRAISLNPRQIRIYGNKLVQGQPFPSITVQGTSITPLQAIQARSPSSGADLNVVLSNTEKKTFELHVTPPETLSPGPFRFDVILEATSATGKPIPPVKIPVEGMVLADVQAVPTTLALGTRPLGEMVSQTVLLRSVGNHPFEVEGISATSESTTVEFLEIPGTSGKPFQIQQRISHLGQQRSSVEFVIQSQNRQSTIRLPIIYAGTAPSEK